MDGYRGLSRQNYINKNKLTTKTLVLAAIFVSMNIILTRIGVIMLFGGSVRFSFGNVPLILSGMILGPFAGGMTGAVGDILGVFINSHGGGFHPGFTLSAILTGLLPGVVVTLSPGKKITLFNLILSNICILILVSLLLNTYWISQLQGDSYLVLLPVRATASTIITVINSFLSYSIIKALEKTNLMSYTV